MTEKNFYPRGLVKLRKLIESSVANWILVALIIFSSVCYSIETLPELSIAMKIFLRWSEVLVIVVFTIEYFIRIITAQNKLKFFFSFYGLVDLIAILPFYIAPTMDLRSLRLLRLARLIVLLKVFRFNSALVRFGRALFLAKEELIIFTVASLVLIYLSAIGIFHFEHKAQPEAFRTIFDSLWWSVVTLTTVGYGDIFPVTVGGRVFTFVVLLIGLGLIAVPTGIVASALSAVRRQQEVTDRESEGSTTTHISERR